MQLSDQRPIVVVMFGIPTKTSRRNDYAHALVAEWNVLPHPVALTTESIRCICHPPLPTRERSPAETSLIYGLMCHAAELLVQSGRSVIISGVFEDRQVLDSMATKLSAKKVYIKAPLLRGDQPQTPEARSESIHLRGLQQHFEEYNRDFEIDTGIHSPENAARLLLAWLGANRPQSTVPSYEKRIPARRKFVAYAASAGVSLIVGIFSNYIYATITGQIGVASLLVSSAVFVLFFGIAFVLLHRWS